MKPKNTTQPPVSQGKKRFHVQKLEERIAPKRGGKGTNNCEGGGDSGQSSGTAQSCIPSTIF
jgi:hypothetical protein